MQSCLICGGELKVVENVYDDRYGFPGEFQLQHCKDCGHKSLNAHFSSKALSQLYTDYYPRSSYSLEEHRPYFERSGFKAWFDGVKFSAFRWIPKNVRILDIGCGFGETLGYHKSRGCDVYGVEADENIQRVSEKFGYKIHIGLFDPADFPPQYFDYVTLDQVIEHVADPEIVLSGIARVLKSSGKVVISTPNANGWGANVFGRKWINWHAPYHLQFFSKQSIKIVAQKAGLILEQAKTITNSDWLFLQWNHMLMYPKIGKASQFWGPVGQRSIIKKIMSRVLFVLHRLKFNHILTRVFDALGVGDNYVFVFRKKDE